MIDLTKDYVEEKYTIENGYKHDAKVRQCSCSHLASSSYFTVCAYLYSAYVM